MGDDLAINIQTVRAGQARPYADSFYEFIITVNKDYRADFVKQLCTKVLRPATQTKADWDAGKGEAGSYFAGWYTFEKLADGRTFKYLKCEPFTD